MTRRRLADDIRITEIRRLWETPDDEVIEQHLGHDANWQAITAIKYPPKELKGRKQVDIVRATVYATPEQSSIKQIYERCRRATGFDEVFDCKEPNARIRTILQRNCSDCAMYHDERYRGEDIFRFDKATRSWGPRTERPVTRPPADLQISSRSWYELNIADGLHERKALP